MTAQDYEDAINRLHQAFWLTSDVKPAWAPDRPIYQPRHPNIPIAIDHIGKVMQQLICEAQQQGYKVTRVGSSDVLKEKYIVEEE